MRGQLGQQLLVERPLARQRPLAGRQRLVLEGLQFRRDVAFGRFQRLAAPVLGGDAVGMTAAHLNVETVHAVVAHLQRGDAGTLALARFHLGQKAVAAGVDVAQLVKLGIEAGADHAAVADHRGWLVQQCGRQPFADGRIDVGCLGQLLQRGEGCRLGLSARNIQLGLQLRDAGTQDRQAVAQRHQLARPCAAQHDARRNPLDVGRLREQPPDGLCHVLFQQQRHQRLASVHGGAVLQRCQQPLAQQPAAGRRGADIHPRQQRRPLFLLQRAYQFQISACHLVDDDVRLAPHALDGLQVPEGLADVLTQIDQQRTDGGLAGLVLLQLGGVQRLDAQGLADGATGTRHVELPVRPGQDGHHRRGAGMQAQTLQQHRLVACRCLGHQQLARADPLDLGFQLGLGQGGERAAPAGRHHGGQRDLRCDPGTPSPRIREHQCGQRPVLAFGQQLRVRQRAGRDGADHLSLHGPLAGGRIADLLTDGHRLAQRHQPRQVLFQRLHGHPRHRDRLAGRRAALGQRDRQQLRRLAGIVVEHLVKVAHPVEKQRIRMFGLDAQVLAHHRRVGGEVDGGHGGQASVGNQTRW